ncbi:hypothetical protein [Methylocapsa sp. S129]|uniref:hypothetical protein n=1 Tax=Methylocapsa sp. S129 TaxID=1641869 RepID=UPI00131CF2E3|nr:hypothetical protein [Methylocapsa sp. S129]
MTTQNVFMSRLTILQEPLSGDRLDQFGAEDPLVPSDDLLDAAQRAQPFEVAAGMGRIEKIRARAACLQDSQREFIGAVNDPEKLIVENFVRRLGILAKDDAERHAGLDGGAIGKVTANVV